MTSILLLALAMTLTSAQLSEVRQPQEIPLAIEPSGTYLYDVKDGQELYLDIYESAEGSETSVDGIAKPTVIFLFGGGFAIGTRDNPRNVEWFKAMTDRGFRIVAIDYRLALKDKKFKHIGVKFIKALRAAVDTAVEDLFSATCFLVDNAAELGIDPAALVVSGGSAGAMTSMQAEWEICNGGPHADVLPEGFNYAGVMSFAGAIFSDQGALRFASDPCPTMLLHGTADVTVPYTGKRFFKLNFSGSSNIAKVLADGGYSYRMYRFDGNAHEVAAAQIQRIDDEENFLIHSVMMGEHEAIDETVSDPAVVAEEWSNISYRNLYD